MKISKLIKGLELFKDQHGDIKVEALHNVLDDKFKQHDYVTGLRLLEVEKEKVLFIQTGGNQYE